jgi:hypothetical protein
MRRAIIGATAAATLALTAVLSSAALASTTHARHVTFTFLGAPVSSNENVYDVRGAGVRGAATQIVKVNKAGSAGTDTLTTYDGQGTTVTADSFTLTPGTNGVVNITGSGHFVRGTGRYAHVSGHYTFAGTENTKTLVIQVKATGVESY